MEDIYYLFDTESKKPIGKVVALNREEVSKLNYAYALNGSSLRYENAFKVFSQYWDNID